VSLYLDESLAISIASLMHFSPSAAEVGTPKGYLFNLGRFLTLSVQSALHKEQQHCVAIRSKLSAISASDTV
jgi:hypothetical protein